MLNGSGHARHRVIQADQRQLLAAEAIGARPRTVGFGRDGSSGPADELHSHTVNDQIPLAQLQPAMAFYAMFTELYLAAAPDAVGG